MLTLITFTIWFSLGVICAIKHRNESADFSVWLCISILALFISVGQSMTDVIIPMFESLSIYLIVEMGVNVIFSISLILVTFAVLSFLYCIYLPICLAKKPAIKPIAHLSTHEILEEYKTSKGV